MDSTSPRLRAGPRRRETAKSTQMLRPASRRRRALARSPDQLPATPRPRTARSVVASAASIQIAKAAALRVRLFVPSWRRRTTRDVLAAGDAERERLAQDLHDGAQQHLTALRVRLSLAADRFAERGETEASAVLQGFGDDVDHLIDELRDLAHGIYPALLTSFGLAAALRSAGVRSGRAVTVQASGVRRCRPEVEIAVYFSCLAALDNAAKHAGPVPVSVDLSDTGGALDFTVCDSGAGFDPAKRRSARGSRTCATASPPSAARSRSTRRRRAERGCMAACRTPAGDNRCSTRGPLGSSSSESARPDDHRGQSRHQFEARATARARDSSLSRGRTAMDDERNRTCGSRRSVRWRR